MVYDSRTFHRRSIRLRGYDYSQPGAYFVTAVTKGRVNLFGAIINGEISANSYGEVVRNALIELPHHYPNVSLDEYVTMPNHLHAIILINSDDFGRGGSFQLDNLMHITSNEDYYVKINSRQTRPYKIMHHALPEIVRAFKSFSARRINQMRHTHGEAIWQRNYYEHIIRGQRELDQIRLYIMDNPRRWTEDI